MVVVVVVELLPVLWLDWTKALALDAKGSTGPGVTVAGLGGALLPVPLSTASALDELDVWYERNQPRALAAPTRPVPVRFPQAYVDEDEVLGEGELDAGCADDDESAVACNEMVGRSVAGLLPADVSVELSSADDWEHLLAVASVLDVVMVEPAPEYGW